MSFDQVFKNITGAQSYLTSRDGVIQNDENSPLFAGAEQSDSYGQGSNNHTVGFGFDLSQNQGSYILSAFQAAGISLRSDQQSFLQSWVGGKRGDTSSLDLAFKSLSISSVKAKALFDYSIADTQAALRTRLIAGGVSGDTLAYATGQTGLNILLLSNLYNGILGDNQIKALASGDAASLIADQLFNNVKLNGSYNDGLETGVYLT